MLNQYSTGTPDWGDDVFKNVRIRDAGSSSGIRRTSSLQSKPERQETVSAQDPSELPDALRPLLRQALATINGECTRSGNYTPATPQQINIIGSNLCGMTNSTQSNILVAHFIRSFTDCLPQLPANDNLSWAVALFNACLSHRQNTRQR